MKVQEGHSVTDRRTSDIREVMLVVPSLMLLQQLAWEIRDHWHGNRSLRQHIATNICSLLGADDKNMRFNVIIYYIN